MQLIAQLQLCFARPGHSRPPQNLIELAALLGQSKPGPEVAEYALLWAEELERIQRADNQILSKKRGLLRRLWATQCLIYQDLIVTLRQLAWQIQRGLPVKHQLDELMSEFSESIKTLNDWTRSEQPRCLNCGWDKDDEICPHCQLRLLAPVRHTHPATAPLQLPPRHQEIFETVVAVIDGEIDIGCLQEPLEQLQVDFEEAVLDAHSSARIYPEMQSVAEVLSSALAGLLEMSLVFEDRDCQHLEDGWNTFFLSQLSLQDTLAEADQMTWMRE